MATPTLKVWKEKNASVARLHGPKNRSAVAGWAVGHIRRLDKDRGVIAVHDGTSSKRSGPGKPASHGAEVFFFSDCVQECGIPLRPGDTVEYTLLSRTHAAAGRLPKASKVRLLKFGRSRGQDEYSAWLVGTKELADKGQVVEFLSRLDATAVWRAILSEPYTDSTWTETIIQALIDFKHRSQGHKETYRSFIQSAIRTSFFNPKGGHLMQYLDATSQRLAFDITLVAKFLLELASANDTIIRVALPFLERLAALTAGSRCPLDTCFLEFIRVAAAVTGDMDTDLLQWSELPLVPTGKELCGDDDNDGDEADGHDWMSASKEKPSWSSSSIPTVRRHGPYDSVTQYLDTYVRLLREDCFAALKEGIRNLLANQLDLRDMNVYTNIEFVGLEVQQGSSHVESGGKGLSFALHIKPLRANVNWRTSRNLMFGNLLCISTDGKFDRPLWATVSSNDLLPTKQIVLVEPCTEVPGSDIAQFITILKQSSAQATVMVESPAYYRSYHPILTSLQSADPSFIPFQEEIVKCNSRVVIPPDYLSIEEEVDDPVVINASCLARSTTAARRMSRVPLPDLLSVLNDPESELSVDQSQRQAIAHALTHRISVIQGPPGTGKTYIGVKLIEMLISASSLPKNSQILVLTYKNHALDEFLLACKSFVNVVRVGGRSEEEELQSCTLREVIRENRRSYGAYHMRESLDEKSQALYSSAGSVAAANCFSVSCFIDHARPEFIMQLLLGIQHYRWPPHLYRLLCTLLPRCHLDEWIRTVHMGSLKHVVHFALCCWMPQPAEFDRLRRSFDRQTKHEARSWLIPQAAGTGTEDQDEALYDEQDIQNDARDRQAAGGHVGTDGKDLKVAYFKNTTDSGPGAWPSLIVGIDKQAAMEMEALLSRGVHMWQMTSHDRAIFIQHLLCERAEQCHTELLECLQDYSSQCHQFAELDAAEVTAALKKTQNLVGMTITGAAIKHQLLSSLQPAIVVVEEAAEVLEPQLLAALGPWVKHLIMIGDHQQLRPPVESYNLVRNHYFDVSMMERLLNNDMPHGLLLTQNRMRPEFSKLLVDIYPTLRDNLDVVSKNKAPDCMVDSMYFWHHTASETSGRSHTNKTEVDMVCQLALFFVQQGYRPSQVTVLSPYQGQTIVLRRALRERLGKVFSLEDHPDIAASVAGKPTGHSHVSRTGKGQPLKQQQVARVRREEVLVHTIDRYQGDENEIVIVSLVRSNRENKIGFLESLNRRCVAQSRAKCGLYFVGNEVTLCNSRKSKHWLRLISTMKNQGLVSSVISVVCPRHPEKVIRASTADELPVNAAGFCDVVCGELLPCEIHVCAKRCQPAHPHKRCRFTVSFTFPQCQHSTKKECWEDEKRLSCSYPVEFACRGENCTARHTRQCSEDREALISARCTAMVVVDLPCGHRAEKQCLQDKNAVPCSFPCSKKLNKCGHDCSARCGALCASVPCKMCAAIEKKRQDDKRQELQEEINAIKMLRDAQLESAADSDVADGVCKNVQSGAAEREIRQSTLTLLSSKLHFSREPHIVNIQEIENLQMRIAHRDCWRKFSGSGVTSELLRLPFDAQVGKTLEDIVQKGFEDRYSVTVGGQRLCSISSAESLLLPEVSSNIDNYLLWCDVALGRVTNYKKLPQDLPGKKGRKFESVYIEREGDQKGHYCVFDHRQVLPRFVVRYKCKPLVKVLDLALEQRALKTGQFLSHTVHPRRGTVEGEGDDEAVFSRASEKFLRNKDSKAKINVTRVTYFVQPRLLEKFVACRSNFSKEYSGSKNKKYREMIAAFHTTDANNVHSIMCNNFNLDFSGSATSHAGKFGRGIYFSEFPDYSLKYGGARKAVLLCYVLPGKPFECTKIEPGRGREPGFNSHVYQPDEAGYGKELCFFSTDQILPAFHIEFEVKEIKPAAAAQPAATVQSAATAGGTRPVNPVSTAPRGKSQGGQHGNGRKRPRKRKK